MLYNFDSEYFEYFVKNKNLNQKNKRQLERVFQKTPLKDIEINLKYFLSILLCSGCSRIVQYKERSITVTIEDISRMLRYTSNQSQYLIDDGTGTEQLNIGKLKLKQDILLWDFKQYLIRQTQQPKALKTKVEVLKIKDK